MGNNMESIINAAPNNQLIQNTLMKMDLKLQHYKNPVCSVSGGSDSDTMLDLIELVRMDRPVTYVFFDTGIEYEVTKRHLDALEAKYDVEIVRRKAVVPVPSGCRQYGVPFLSKQVSEFISRLQAHSFQWVDKPFDILCAEYPNCKSALRWWCNEKNNDGKSMFNINQILFLKEYIIANPPTFTISQNCCEGAKKNPAGLFYSEINTNISITGLRQMEGGVRASTYNSCFSAPNDTGLANYRPLWFLDRCR